MAHWAEVNENNLVLRVVVTSNEEPDEGYQWLMDNLGGRWIKTSYNSRGGKHWTWGEETVVAEDGNINKYVGPVESGKPHLRYNYAGPGYTYDETRDAFIPPKPEDGEWILNEETCQWDEVIPIPEGG